MFQISKRGIAKYAMHVIIGAASHQVITTAVGTVYDPQDESTQDTVELASNIASAGVVMTTWSAADRLVDRIADKRAARKEAKNNEPAPAAV